jgi:hypothetical protein
MPGGENDWGSEGWRRNMHELVNVALLAAGLVLLCRGVWLCFGTDVALGLSCLGAALVLLLAATIDRFETLKGLGLEAKTREVTQRIKQADELFKKLQDLAAHVYAGIVKQAAGDRYWQSAFDEAELNQLANETRARMRQLDISEDLIRRALTPWTHEVLWRWVCVAAKPWFDAIDQAITSLQSQADSANLTNSSEDGARRLELRAKVSELQKFRGEEINSKLFRHPRTDLIPELVRLMDRTPAEVDRSCHAVVQQTIEDWRDEIAHLMEQRELKSVSRWNSFIGWKVAT